MTEAAWAYMKQGDADRYEAIRKTWVADDPRKTLWNLVPATILPLIEWAANYSAFRGGPIVPEWDMDQATDLQYTEWTSETAKMIGKAVPIGPAFIDHLVMGYTAGFGRGTLSVVDKGLKVAGVTKGKSAGPVGNTAQDYVLTGNFFRDATFGASSESIQAVYEAAEQIAELEKTIKTDPASRVARIADAKDRGVPWSRREQIKIARARFTDIGKQIRTIRAAPETAMSPEKKRAALDQRYEMMVSVARRALGKAPLKEGTR
jgi:hypothetical protein